MSVIQNRKERERAERHQRIIDSARELAEAQGWDAVTVRKLAERIEYSQPVLYSHFAGKDAIVSAVAEQGFSELAAVARQLRSEADSPEAALRAVAEGYLTFARESSALYDAMFLLRTELKFGPEASQPLKDAYTELAITFAPFAPPHDVETFTEVAWSTLHGLATLDRGGRLRPDFRALRLEILLAQWIGNAG
ncbi:TetR/AcrR family transcriptional regulator [Nocardia huaxiensis]|uniref:TetR/AcrR family transcriptional regulator n=1 Tax=Nocardia huaxiensis TaxID=2755382 RepID=A0A7D6ZJX6_9NOCA|nr:TetR/AcrR family transcriptional regulator [Nocardia huaxiensis]QLY32899.1 TetR/AcrR family transcriptional regulator [Nocardia huaxiensis]UFS93341.1 TetR/AcrR family transcriptional regulator [Nocardia huaxiensis]